MSHSLVMDLVRRADLPGLAVVAVAVAAAFAAEPFVGVSPLVVGVVLGAIVANSGLLTARFRPGITYASKRLLRIGIVLLGLRLSFDEMRDLGIVGVIAVVIVVLATFFGVQALARAMGLSSGLGLLVATGYSICGASAVAAMAPLSDADEEETAYAIGLVTLCGSLSPPTRACRRPTSRSCRCSWWASSQRSRYERPVGCPPMRWRRRRMPSRSS